MIDSDSTDYLYSIIHFFVLNCNFLVLVFLFFYCIIFFNKILLLYLQAFTHFTFLTHNWLEFLVYSVQSVLQDVFR